MNDYGSLKQRFEAAGQEQVFAFWESLKAGERRRLADEAASIDLEEVNRLSKRLLHNSGSNAPGLDGLEPAPHVPHPAHGGDAAVWKEAHARGAKALRDGRVAAFTVAGGQGTRLGYDAPKGTFPATPVRRISLYQVFAEKILAANRKYGVHIPWYIMTSHQNHEATQAFFDDNRFFGLAPATVSFFRQGRMPAVDFQGKIMLESKCTIALNPDGHGGALRALVRSGSVDAMEEAGIDIMSYFQVDNPLVHCIDPAFIGFHIESSAEFSSKMVPKAYPGEKLGHFCRDKEGRLVVIEYSDMPEELAEATDADGQLRFRAGNIAIHTLGRDFVRRVGSGRSQSGLPFHRADKKIATVDSRGEPIRPESPNGIKFEMFVFDALPLARDPVIVETLRPEEFSPIKNAEGVDSPETSRNDQLRQWTRWARAARVDIPCDDSGLPEFAWEVSPLFADTEGEFLNKWHGLNPKPAIESGVVLR